MQQPMECTCSSEHLRSPIGDVATAGICCRYLELDTGICTDRSQLLVKRAAGQAFESLADANTANEVLDLFMVKNCRCQGLVNNSFVQNQSISIKMAPMKTPGTVIFIMVACRSKRLTFGAWCMLPVHRWHRGSHVLCKVFCMITACASAPWSSKPSKTPLVTAYPVLPCNVSVCYEQLW